MDIKAISTLSLPSVSSYAQPAKSQNTSTGASTTNMQDKISKKIPAEVKKNLPYYAGSAVLGLVIGCFIKGKGNMSEKALQNLKNKIIEELNQEQKKNITDEIKQLLDKKDKILAELKEISQELKNKTDEVRNIMKEETKQKTVTNLDELTNNMKKNLSQKTNSPAVTKTEEAVKTEIKNKPFLLLAEHKATEEEKALKEAKKSLNLLNDDIISKIMKNRKSEASEIDRIVGENIKDGHVDMNIMRKVARDFSADQKNRGENRFHQAADILEQSYLREFIKANEKGSFGLDEMYNTMKNDSDLFSIYKQMPVEESANRLNYIVYNDLLKYAPEKGMTKEEFFEKMLAKLFMQSQK